MLFPLAVSGIIRHTPSSGSRLSGLGRHGKSRLDLYIDNLNFGDLILMCTPKFGLINNSDSMSSVLYRAHVV